MALYTKIPIVGGSYDYRSRGVSSQRTINMYPENIDNGQGKIEQSLVYTAGETLLSRIGNTILAPCRGLYYSSTGPDNKSVLYAVYGNKVYRVNETGINEYESIEIGTVQSGSSSISIVDNGFKLYVADGATLYQADLTASDVEVPLTWRQVDLPPLAGEITAIQPSVVLFLAQRLIINSQRNQFYFSTLPDENGEVLFTDPYGVPNFYSAEGSADSITSMTVSEDRLYLFGERSYEIWGLNSGDQTGENPFSKIGGSTNQIGCQAPRSVATNGDFVFWLGGSDSGRNTVFLTNGLSKPQRISTNAIEYELANTITDTQGAIGWSYYSEGHTFYVLTFIDSQKTFLYEISTQLWHERSTRDWETTTDKHWEPIYGVSAYNKVLHGGSSQNTLIELNSAKYTDWQDLPVIRTRVTPLFSADLNPVSINEFLLDCEVGTTPLLTGLGRDPQIMLEVSLDGGFTFNDMGWRSIGRQGDYQQFVKWTNLGRTRGIVFRIVCSDPSPIVIYGGRIGIQGSVKQ